jgi:hypothetical protein
MSVLTYSMQSSKNDLPVSSEELATRYFFGIPIKDPNGNIMTDENIAFYIKAATLSFEGLLNIKLTKQVIEENLPYKLNEYQSWGFIPTSFPIIEIGGLTGFLGNIEQVKYPLTWLSIKRSNDPTAMHRMMYIVPTAGTPDHESITYSGISPHVGWFGQQQIPNYWTVRYCTSFNILPEDILDAIGKLAAINIFHQLGDIILGAGIASQSLGIDGLSQSISTTSSATNAGYGARIGGYLTDLKQARIDLKNKYDGSALTVG